jgi:hypothetical protein
VKILLRIQDIYFLDGQPTWRQDSSCLRIVLQALEQAGLWGKFGYYGPEGGQRRKIDSLEDLLETGTTFKTKTYTLVNDVETPSARLELDFKTGALTFHLVFEPVFLKHYQENLLLHLIDAVCHIHDALGDKALMGPLVNVEIIGAVYPRVRPPRLHRRIVFGTLVNIVSQNFHAQHPLGSPEEVKKILAAPLPDNVQRIDHGDLVIFRWAEDVRDEQDVARRRSQQEQWLVQVLNPPLDPSYNAAGDYLVMAVRAVGPDAHLTWYDATRKYGYKAVVVFPNGGVDEDLFAEMADWLKRRQLPDDRELEALSLITQSRAAALSIHDRAIRMGFKAVYYSDNKARLWDPFPPGLWLET